MIDTIKLLKPVLNCLHFCLVYSVEGLDIALCVINLNNNKLQYSGAFSPLIVIRENKDTGIAELMEIKSDRMPIGIGLKEKPFTNTEIQLQTDDLLYLFSDGYAD